jgi:hypothetical protein
MKVVALKRVSPLSIDFLDQLVVVLVKYYIVVDKRHFVEEIVHNHMVPLAIK